MRHFAFSRLIGLLFAVCGLAASVAAQTYSYEQVEGDPMHTRIYTLQNGLKVYLSVNDNEPRIQADIAVRTGSRNDPAETTGLAHYLEHLMFKGTQQFGTTSYESEQPYLDEIERRYEAYRLLTDPEERRQAYHEIDSVSQIAAQWNIPNEYDKLMALVGSDVSNAFTSFDITCYTEEIPSNQIENWARIQSDRFQNMVIRGFHTELEAVYEEYNIYLSDDGEKAVNALLRGLFPTHTYGTQTTIGTQEHLKNPSITNIKEYYHRYYCPNNVAICMSGDFNPDEVIRIIDRYFGQWQANPQLSHPQFAAQPAILVPIDTTVVGLEAESLLMGFRFAGGADLQNDTLALLGLVLYNGRAGLFDLDVNQKMLTLGCAAGSYALADYSMLYLQGEPREGQTLDEVRAIILAEIDKLKVGDFSDELLTAVVANMKRYEQKELEQNRNRTSLFHDAFVQGIPWQQQVERMDRLSRLTKQDIVDFARRHLSQNYVCVYKRQGDDTTLVKIDKPEITAIPANREYMSQYVREIADAQVRPIEPRFLDFQRDLTVGQTSRRLPLIYKQNNENQLFQLSFRLPFGLAADKRLENAVDYLDLLGTQKMSAEAIQQRFYTLACSYSISVDDYHTSINLYGLDENMDEALQLLEELLHGVVADDEAYEAYVANLAKAQTDAKQEQRTCFSRLKNYGLYGPRVLASYGCTASELGQIQAQTLVDLIRSLENYEHTVLYYGPRSEQALNKLLARKHRTPRKLLAAPVYEDFMEQPTPEPAVYIAPYDAKNIYLMGVSNEQRQWSAEMAPVAAMFNEYFGAGMNGIVFQELRESRGLAYSASASYETPSRKGHPEFSYIYIISQNDKMPECINTFNQILDTIPQAEASFEVAKQSLTTQLSTKRTTRASVLYAYLAAQELGIDYDINECIYRRLPDINLSDIVEFANTHMAAKPRLFLILGNEAELDMPALEAIGTVKRLSLEEIFGY